jgi:hypothetical protein
MTAAECCALCRANPLCKVAVVATDHTPIQCMLKDATCVTTQVRSCFACHNNLLAFVFVFGVAGLWRVSFHGSFGLQWGFDNASAAVQFFLVALLHCCPRVRQSGVRPLYSMYPTERRPRAQMNNRVKCCATDKAGTCETPAPTPPFQCPAAAPRAFCDQTLSIGERAAALVANLTTAEKIAQVGSNGVPAITRLGIPGYAP